MEFRSVNWSRIYNIINPRHTGIYCSNWNHRGRNTSRTNLPWKWYGWSRGVPREAHTYNNMYIYWAMEWSLYRFHTLSSIFFFFPFASPFNAIQKHIVYICAITDALCPSLHHFLIYIYVYIHPLCIITDDSMFTDSLYADFMFCVYILVEICMQFSFI